MTFLRTMFGMDDSGEILIADTIEHEGKLWIVPEWLYAQKEGWQTPARIIQVDCLKHQKMPDDYPADLLLNNPMPRAVLDGNPSPEQAKQYVVVERPDIRIQVGGLH